MIHTTGSSSLDDQEYEVDDATSDEEIMEIIDAAIETGWRTVTKEAENESNNKKDDLTWIENSNQL